MLVDEDQREALVNGNMHVEVEALPTMAPGAVEADPGFSWKLLLQHVG